MMSNTIFTINSIDGKKPPTYLSKITLNASNLQVGDIISMSRKVYHKGIGRHQFLFVVQNINHSPDDGTIYIDLSLKQPITVSRHNPRELIKARDFIIYIVTNRNYYLKRKHKPNKPLQIFDIIRYQRRTYVITNLNNQTPYSNITIMEKTPIPAQRYN